MASDEIFWDQILFCIAATVFLVLNVLNLRSTISRKIVDNTNNNNNNTNTNANSNTNKREQAKTEQQKERKYWKHLKVLLTFYALFLSPILFVGFATETYLVGSQLLINLASVTIGYIIAFVFLLPIIFGLDKSIKTPYEYFQKRFDGSRWPRLISALSASCFYFALGSLFLYGAIIILTSFLPMPIWLASLLVGLYSSMAVIGKQNSFKFTFWTSLGQFGVFLVGVIGAILITWLFHPVYSAQELAEIMINNNRWRIIIDDGSPTVRYTVWNQLFSLPIPWAVVHCLTAANFTKYRSMKTKNHSRMILVLNIPFMLCVNSLFWFSGICAFLYFYGCDPVHSPDTPLANKNQISTKWFIAAISTYAPCVSGVAMSCLFVSSIYQQSMSLSACGKTLVNDVFANKCIERHIERIKKALYCTLVALSIGFAVLLSYAKNSILSLFFFFNNTFNSPILGLFLLSVLNPYANAFGATLSFFLCLAFEIWRSTNIFFFSNLKSPELKPQLQNCSTITTQANMNNNSSTFSSVQNIYYPTNSALFYLFSISSIWFCLFSVFFVVIFGSLFSVLYSLVRHRKWAHYVETRAEYLASLKGMKFERAKKTKENENRI